MGVFFVLTFSAAVLFLGMHRGDCADIIGGKISVPHSRPFMAALISGYRFCGGTLIKKDWVLTAAHCKIKKGDKAILGAHSLTKYEKEKQEFQIIKTFPHPNFDKQTLENDIMLLKLNKKATITKAVKPIALPQKYYDVRPGTQCLVAGWGSTKNGGKASDVLQEVNVTIIDRRICNDKKHYNRLAVTFNMLCAGDVKNPCEGDSGGPLICSGIQRGITSFVDREGGCGNPQFPVVYTRLTKGYLRWIKKTVAG